MPSYDFEVDLESLVAAAKGTVDTVQLFKDKDVEDLVPALASGRIDADQVRTVLEAATEVTERLDRDDRWWAPWDGWAPGP